MLKLGAALLALPLAAAGMAASATWLVVDVREGGPEGQRIVVPVPLVAAQAVLAFVPESHTRVELPEEAREHLPLAHQVIDALAAAPDVELVRVEDGEDLVVVEKAGEVLRVHVSEGNGEVVDVSVPLAAVQEILEDAEDGTLDARDVVRALRYNLRYGDLVRVSDHGDRVNVWVW
jgi:hypothetical protein